MPGLGPEFLIPPRVEASLYLCPSPLELGPPVFIASKYNPSTLTTFRERASLSMKSEELNKRLIVINTTKRLKSTLAIFNVNLLKFGDNNQI